MFLPEDHNQLSNVAMGPNISVSEDLQLKVKRVELPHRIQLIPTVVKYQARLLDCVDLITISRTIHCECRPLADKGSSLDCSCSYRWVSLTIDPDLASEPNDGEIVRGRSERFDSRDVGIGQPSLLRYPLG